MWKSPVVLAVGAARSLSLRPDTNELADRLSGLGQSLWWPAWFKKHGIKFWLVFCERFGAPTPWGKYPHGTSKGDQDTLLSALEAMQQENAIVTPEGMMVELIEAAQVAVDEFIDVLGRASIEAVLELSASGVAGPRHQGKAGGETRRHGKQSPYASCRRRTASSASLQLTRSLSAKVTGTSS